MSTGGELSVMISVMADKALDTLENVEKQTKQVGQAAKGTGDELRRGLDSAFDSLVSKAVPIASVTSAVLALSGANADLAEAGKTADKYGLPLQAVQSWGRAAEIMGFKAEDATGALATLQRGMQKAALTGQGEVAGMLHYLGISMVDASGKTKDADTLMRELSLTLADMDQGKALELASMMGLSPDQVALLRAGPALIDEVGEAYKHANTDAQRAANDRFSASMMRLKWVGKDLASNLLQELIPTFERILHVVTPVAEFFASNPWLTVAAVGVINFRSKLGTLIPIISKVATFAVSALRMVSAAVIANPIGAAIAALSLALVDLWHFWKGGESVIGNFLSWLGVGEKSLNTFRETIGAVANGIKELIKGVFELITNPVDKLGKVWDSFKGLLPSMEDFAVKFGGGGDKQDATMVPPSVTQGANVSNRSVNIDAHYETTVNAQGASPVATRQAVSGALVSANDNLRTTATNFNFGVLDK